MTELSKKYSNSPPTLVKYQPAVQIYQSMRSYHQRSQEAYQHPHTSPKSHANTNSDYNSNQQNVPPKMEDIINGIIPPRDWVDNMDKLYIQYVSHQPASRQDVIDLRDRLNKMLEDRQARTQGVCPIRQQLYSQAFDEIIRQVAVDCPQRGLLLMRVRDQHRMSLAAYQTIYQSSVVFGMKKQVQSQDGTQNLQQQEKSLIKKKQQLQDKRDMLICRKQLLQRQIRQRRTAQTKKRQDELKFLQTQTQNLTKFLQIIKDQPR